MRLDYTVCIGLDGRWVTGTVEVPDYIPEALVDEDVKAMLILNDAYAKGEISVSYTEGEDNDL